MRAVESTLLFFFLILLSFVSCQLDCQLSNPVQSGYSTSWWTLDTSGNTQVGQKWLTPVTNQAVLTKITIPLYSITGSTSTVNAYLVLDNGAGQPSTIHITDFYAVSVSASGDFLDYDFYPYLTTILYPNTNYWFVVYPASSSDEFRWATTTSPSVGPGTILEISATFNVIWTINPNVVSATQIAIFTSNASTCASGGISDTCDTLENLSGVGTTNWWSISNSENSVVAQQWLTSYDELAALVSVSVLLQADTSASVFAGILLDNGGIPDLNKVVYGFPIATVPSGTSFEKFTFTAVDRVYLSPNTFYWLALTPSTAYDAFRWQTTTATSTTTGSGYIPQVSATYNSGVWSVTAVTANTFSIQTGVCSDASAISSVLLAVYHVVMPVLAW